MFLQHPGTQMVDLFTYPSLFCPSLKEITIVFTHAYLDVEARYDAIFRWKAHRHDGFDFFSPRFRNLGRVNHLLVFAFNGFEIGRYITADVRDPQQAILKPCTPYQRPYSQTNQAQQKVANGFSGDDSIIPGEKTLRYTVNEISNLLLEGVLLHLNYLGRKVKEAVKVKRFPNVMLLGLMINSRHEKLTRMLGD